MYKIRTISNGTNYNNQLIAIRIINVVQNIYQIFHQYDLITRMNVLVISTMQLFSEFNIMYLKRFFLRKHGTSK